MAKFVEIEGGSQSAIPGNHPALGPVVFLIYNAGDELIKIRKYINGKIFEREIVDPDITDYVTDRTVEYRAYMEV